MNIFFALKGSKLFFLFICKNIVTQAKIIRNLRNITHHVKEKYGFVILQEYFMQEDTYLNLIKCNTRFVGNKNIYLVLFCELL